MNAFFQAAIECTEEAIINAVVAAETMTGINGFSVPSLPHAEVRALLQKIS